VRSIGVDEHDDVAGGLVEGQADGVTLTLAAIEHDPRAARYGDIARTVARVSIDHEHFVGVRTDGIDNGTDQTFLIPGRNNNADCGVDTSGCADRAARVVTGMGINIGEFACGVNCLSAFHIARSERSLLT
jgi:hypothetical protein